MAQKDNTTANALMDQILNGNSQGEQSEQAIQMPELALRCAQFFHSLSQYCLYFYKNYNREADIHKTKLIKKVDKSKKHKSDQSRKQIAEDRKLRMQNEPQPPKKPLTAYILYFQDKKPSFAQKFPTLSLSELTKLIAKDWKDLKDEQKKPYLDKAADDRRRYESQMTEFKRKYRLGEEGRQEQQFIVEENKAGLIMDQKEEQIPIEIEEQIKAAGLLNEGENGIRSEREEDGVNDDENDEEDAEEDSSESGDDEGEEEDELENEGSEEAKINEE